MAGTLTISTLSDGTNSTSATNCIQGSAKAWVSFGGGNGSTAGQIRASYNVSSVTVNGSGDYTVNFTTAFSDTNYVGAGSYTYSSSVGGAGNNGNCCMLPSTTTTARVFVSDGGLSATFSNYMAFFR
jgi:hypothetical protein